MTLKDFLSNPSGKGDTATNMKALASMLDAKYDKLMKNKSDKLKCHIYKVLNKEVYYFHLIIPTETERDNTYDVVIELSDLEGARKGDFSIGKYNARFFSNAPSFAYTYAKVYNDNDLLIQSLVNKFEKEQITQAPEVRNRFGIVGYDKYLYFGVKYVYESKTLSKATLPYQAIRYSAKLFVPKIRSSEKIMQEYHKAERELRKSQGKSVGSKPPKNASSPKDDAGIYVKKKAPNKPIQKTTANKKTVKYIKKT